MECAEIIARLLRSMIPDLAPTDGIRITLLPDGRVELRLRSHLLCSWENGYVMICVSEALPLEVEDVLPHDPLHGDILTILGHGFGRDPGKIGLGVHESNGSRLIPLEVLSATDTRITARMGIAPPGMRSGHLWMSDGSGSDFEYEELLTGRLRADGVVESWRSRIDLGIETHVQIDLTPTEPGPGERPFFSGPPTANGELCVFLNGTWTGNALISIAAAAHNLSSSTGAYHLVVPSIRLCSGNASECAQRIADFIRDAFWRQAAAVVEVRAEPAPNNGAKITLSLPRGVIDLGHLTICIREPPARPAITRFTPASGTKGQLITIHGSGFGDDPNDLHVALRDGSSPRLIPLEVVQVAHTELVARLGAVPPGAQAGHFMVQRGDGNRGLFAPASEDVELNNEFWVWRGRSPVVESPDNFVPLHSEPPLGLRCFHSLPDPLDPYGSICLLLIGDWLNFCPVDSLLSVDVRVMDVDAARLVTSVSGPMYVRSAGSLPDCADCIVDVIRRAMESRMGNTLLVDWMPSPLTNDSSIKVTVRPRSVLDASRLTGLITICIIPPPLMPIIEQINIAGSDIFISLPTHLGLNYTLLHRQSFSARTFLGKRRERSGRRHHAHADAPSRSATNAGLLSASGGVAREQTMPNSFSPLAAARGQPSFDKGGSWRALSLDVQAHLRPSRRVRKTPRVSVTTRCSKTVERSEVLDASDNLTNETGTRGASLMRTSDRLRSSLARRRCRTLNATRDSELSSGVRRARGQRPEMLSMKRHFPKAATAANPRNPFRNLL